MAVQITKEFLTNVTLFILAIVALGLSIGAIMNNPCKDKFGACTPLGEPCYPLNPSDPSNNCCDNEATCNLDPKGTYYPGYNPKTTGFCRKNKKYGPCAGEGNNRIRNEPCCPGLKLCDDGICRKPVNC